MIKYRTQWQEIKAIEVAGETPTQIITQHGRRERKRSDWTNWHDSWEDAHAFLIDGANKKVTELAEELAAEKEQLEKIKAMQKDGK